jgi:hypothetical protein
VLVHLPTERGSGASGCVHVRAGVQQPLNLTVPLLPYKLVYAARLAEYGLVAPALHYVGVVQTTLGSLGAKLPPGLLVCRSMAAELEHRLRTHATVRPWTCRMALPWPWTRNCHLQCGCQQCAAQVPVSGAEWVLSGSRVAVFW